ncbi:hypothetical protein [Chryseobacterium shigense]|uniref:Uncharacterized protein n=1 Tax=Chryseobacterium shigense TaxID=297244 RepID=A0A841N3F0_9FLAO|nr:hypothetical protein [Chryseobacterium shigense]MBB6369673.1 hypothetical protein [Chryseobacterium shigense]
MSIKDKLKVEIRDGSISLEPNRGIFSSLIRFAVTMVGSAVIRAVFHEQLGEGGRLLCLGIIVYFFVHGVIDFVFRLNIRYEFNRYDNAVYRDNPLFGRKHIMNLDEVVIFVNNSSGDWYYAIGIKKKQFLKSYKISPGFGGGKISQRNAFEYEKEILEPIEELISKVQLR